MRIPIALMLLVVSACTGQMSAPPLDRDASAPPDSTKPDGGGGPVIKPPGDPDGATPEPLKPPTPTMVVSSIDELNAAIQTAVSGAVIALKDGIYSDAHIKLSLPDPDNHPKTLPVSHIAIEAESYGGVVFTGNSSITAKGSFLTIEGFVWRDTTSTSVTFNNVDDSTLTRNAFIHAGPSDDGTVVITSGSARNDIVRNRFENLPAQGIRITCTKDCSNRDNHIAHNLFIAKKDARKAKGGNGNVGESIQLGSGYQGSVRYVEDLRTIVEHTC